MSPTLLPKDQTKKNLHREILATMLARDAYHAAREKDYRDMLWYFDYLQELILQDDVIANRHSLELIALTLLENVMDFRAFLLAERNQHRDQISIETTKHLVHVYLAIIQLPDPGIRDFEIERFQNAARFSTLSQTTKNMAVGGMVAIAVFSMAIIVGALTGGIGLVGIGIFVGIVAAAAFAVGGVGAGFYNLTASNPFDERGKEVVCHLRLFNQSYHRINKPKSIKLETKSPLTLVEVPRPAV